MELALAILSFFCLASILLNLYLYRKSKKQKPQQVLSVEAQQILHDMTAHGNSIVRIIPMSPSDIFWRSPK